MDYTLSWRPTPRLNLGVQGYYLQDLEDDRVGSERVSDTRTRVAAAGPGIRYQLGKVALIAKAQYEFAAQNRPQGSNYWLRFVAPL